MKTRAEIYSHEAAELLRAISMYPGLSEEQHCRFFPGKEAIIKNLLSHLKKQGRVIQTDKDEYFSAGISSPRPDSGLKRAAWILLDFIDRVEYHSPSDFPVKIIFFAGGVLYEIVYAAVGQEALVNQVIKQDKSSDSRRIVLLDAPEQIHHLEFPGISGFCTVDADQVNYYKKTNGGM